MDVDQLKFYWQLLDLPKAHLILPNIVPQAK
jgi:hypothetical protein